MSQHGSHRTDRRELLTGDIGQASYQHSQPIWDGFSLPSRSGRQFPTTGRLVEQGAQDQQACGKNWSQREPRYIPGYEKCSPGAPFKDDRVKIWRR
jgi:hypothetical protein